MKDVSAHSRSIEDRIQYYLLFFLRLSVVAAIPFALYFREWGAFGYCLLSLALMFLPRLIRSRANVDLPIEFDVVLVVFMYAAVFLGKVGFAYERFWWWDSALHTSSGFILGYVGFLLLYIKVQQKKIQASRRLIGLIIFSISLAFGAVWEIFEYGVDLLLGGNLQRGSLRDTMGDLMVDAIGALIMARIGVKLIYDGKKGFVERWTRNFIRVNPHLEHGKHER